MPPAGQPRYKVLLIDDSEVSLIVAEALLVDAGYDVRTAGDLHAFTQRLTSWQPDVVLTDVEMPGVTGPELCRRLKANAATAHVPVLLYSTRPQAELAELAASCGADGFVCKSERHEGLPRELAAICAALPART